VLLCKLFCLFLVRSVQVRLLLFLCLLRLSLVVLFCEVVFERLRCFRRGSASQGFHRVFQRSYLSSLLLSVRDILGILFLGNWWLSPACFPIAASRSHIVVMGFLEREMEMPPVPKDIPSVRSAMPFIFCSMLFSWFSPCAKAFSKPWVPFAPQRLT